MSLKKKYPAFAQQATHQKNRGVQNLNNYAQLLESNILQTHTSQAQTAYARRTLEADQFRMLKFPAKSYKC